MVKALLCGGSYTGSNPVISVHGSGQIGLRHRTFNPEMCGFESRLPYFIFNTVCFN